MNYFTVYLLKTGEIVRSGYAPNAEDQPISKDEGLLLTPSTGKGWVTDGKVYSLPEQPNEYSYFDYEQKEWVFDQDSACLAVKNKRNTLLADSDWTDTLSAKGRLGDSLYQRWQEYRQLLRDVSMQPEFPVSVIWPIKPV